MKPLQNPTILPPSGGLRVIAGQAIIDLAGLTLNEDGTLTAASMSGPGILKVLEVPFALADIQAGSLSSSAVPAGALILGVAVEMTTALEFSAGTTTGVTLKAGTSGDDDGYFAATQLSGAAGKKFPITPGALVGGAVAGGANSCALVFVATGGSPNLSQVSGGAGKLLLAYCTT